MSKPSRFRAASAYAAGVVGLLLSAVAAPSLFNYQLVDLNPTFYAASQSYFGPGRIEGSFAYSGSIGGSALGADFFATSGAGNATAALETELQILAPLIRESNSFDIAIDWGASRLQDATSFVAGFGIDLHFLGFTFSPVNQAVSAATGDALSATTPGSWRYASGGGCTDIPAASILIATIGGSVCVDQTARWSIDAIDGTLFASKPGSPTQAFDFRVASSSRQDIVPVVLPSYGEWLFTIGNLSLENRFGSSFAIDAGVFGEVCYIFDCSSGRLTGNVANVNSGDFPLTWSSPSIGESFSVRTVAEPSAASLLIAGLILLAGLRRRAVSLHRED